MEVFDQTGDPNWQQLHRYIRLYPFPDFVKRADRAETLCDDQSPALYADIRNRQFPCHNKVATFVSHLYYLEHRPEIPSKLQPLIEERLAKFAQHWSLTNTVRELRKVHAELHKDASSQLPDSTFAIVWTDDSGRKERHYPLRNALEVKAAAAWFSEYLPQLREQYSFADRQTIAGKILQKAAQLGAGLGDHLVTLEQSAGRGVCDPKQAAQMIRDRIKVGSRVDPAHQVSLEKLAQAIEARPSLTMDPATMSSLAQTIDIFDRSHSLLNRYTPLIPAPEEVLFAETRSKLASLQETCVQTLTGSIYDREDFTNLKVADVRDLFGDELADAVANGLRVDAEKLAEIAPTLPLPDAKLLDQLLADVNVRPLAKQAGQRVGFSHRELQELAGQG